MTELIGDCLRRRVRQAGPEPLVTYYDLASGARTELSAVTFTNWADKTSHLLSDELLLDAGDTVHLALADTFPGHWITLVWTMACWQTGVVVTLGSFVDAAVVVAGPNFDAYAGAAGQLLACSLHPLGLGFDAPLPPGVLDYALEVRGQPDRFGPAPVAGRDLAWVDEERRVTHSDLVAGAAEPAGRRLVRPAGPWRTVRDALVKPLRSGGSSVVVAGSGDQPHLEHIVQQERIEGWSPRGVA